MSVVERLALMAAVSDASGAVNEDAWGQAGRAAWVCDGATGMGGVRRCPGPSDAAWLVDHMVEAMSRLAEQDVPLARWGRSLEALLSKAFTALATPLPLSAAEMPAAAFAAVQARHGRLLCCNLGDCAIVLRTRDGRLRRLGASRVDQFDALVLGLLNDEVKRGGSHATAQPAMRAQILRNRAMANTADGYWVANPQPGWAAHIEIFDENLSEIDRVLLASDGFLRLVDAYGVHRDPGPLLDLDQKGLDGAITTLRDIERNDPECRRYPRIKPSDDATAALFEVRTAA